MVTGASGFIGAHLCRRLVDAGAEVHALSRCPRSGDKSPLTWWEGDVADIEMVRTCFRKIQPETIYHLASHVMGAPNLQHVLPTFQANLQSSVNLLIAAAENGCRRLVMTGSLAEPEPAKGEIFPVAPYAAAKWASSGYARMFHALYGVPAVLARVFMVYGPAQRDLSKLIPYAILSLLQGKSPAISSGGRLVDWIYVDDVVEAYVALADAPGIEGRTVEIGSGKLGINPGDRRPGCISGRRGDRAYVRGTPRPADGTRANCRCGANARVDRMVPENTAGGWSVTYD